MDFIFNENKIADRLKQLDSPERISMHHEYFVNSAVIFLIIPYQENPS